MKKLTLCTPGTPKFVLHELGQRVAADAFGQRHAVVDIDAEYVQRHVEVFADPAGEAQAEVHRLLRLQRRGAQGLRDGIVDRQQAALQQLAGGVVAGRGGFVADLAQRRRAEVVRHRTAQREGGRELVARRQLAGEFAAEIVVMLVARGEVGGELLAELAGQAGVDAGDIARQVGHVLRRQSAAGLRAGRAGR